MDDRFDFMPGRRASLTSVAFMGLVIASIGFCGCSESPGEARRRDVELLRGSQQAWDAGDFQSAVDHAVQINPESHVFRSAMLLAGRSAGRLGRHDEALDFLRHIEWDESAQAIDAAITTAESLRAVGKLDDALSEYSRVQSVDHDHAEANRQLAFLNCLAGRKWESRDAYLRLLKSGAMTLVELAVYADFERSIDATELLELGQRIAEQDRLVLLGTATQSFVEGKLDQAVAQLQRVTSEFPEEMAAQAMLGELLLESDDDEFREWHRRLPPVSDRHPEIWYVRGVWLRREASLKQAGRCFWEALQRAPCHRRATYQLGQVLQSLDVPEGTTLLARADRQYQLSGLLDGVLEGEVPPVETFRQIVDCLQAMGRLWEAAAWSTIAERLYPQQEWARLTRIRCAAQLKPETPRTILASDLSRQLRLSDWPDHQDVLTAETGGAKTLGTFTAAEPQIHFQQAEAAGLNFVYENGADPNTAGARMFEWSGGGVAVIDFDLDGWPDLYFPQGGEWPAGRRQPPEHFNEPDALYRNLGGREFVRVDGHAGILPGGFGQGCAVGDLNSDGFPDLLVANVGRNQVYLNEGDGTFTEISDQSGISGEDWTTSCAVVDMNADGLADLFEVNYVTAEDVYERICKGLACSPRVFDGVPDQLRVNQGDGTFLTASELTPRTDAKGLGLIVACLESPSRPDVLIANDQVPNFLLRNLPSDNRWRVELVSDGFVRGFAYSENGLPMACMGMAADDVNADGRLDIFVTNFRSEPNTLYLQDTPGLFVDATKASGLMAPSLPFVGWGTQFLDADCDGDPDLVVVNGHVDEYPEDEGGYAMKSQCFRNDGGGRFTELTTAEAGRFFGERRVSRGLARLDWNADGREEFVVSAIGSPATLVTNVSQNVGHWVAFELRARDSARDAIGATVEVRTPLRRRVRQLVAGDGYMSCNQRRLVFGLGDARQLDGVTVRWPSGRVCEFTGLEMDASYLLVEGRSPVILPDARSEQSR